MEDIVEQVKQANPIQDVIEMTYPLERQHGRYLRAKAHDSLVIDTHKQCYHWNAKSESGDVIEWLANREGMDFKTAVEWLCRRAHLPEPKWSREENAKRVEVRAREEILATALGVMQRWLLADGEALAYCRGRGWTDETIREAGLGFSGRNTAAEVEEMWGEYAMRNIDPERPAAAAVIGFRGDVREWGALQGVAVDDRWIEWGFVPSLMAKTRLIYPHYLFGRVQTVSGRNILGAEVNKEGRTVKSYNLPVALAGERQVFFNHLYSARAPECVLIEGQGDAVTLAQWGVAAVALAGTAWADHERLLGELRRRHDALYVGLDADEAGQKALIGAQGEWPLARILGPMARVVEWGAGEEG